MTPKTPQPTTQAPTQTKPTALHWGILGVVALLALVLRLLDPLGDPVLATEKPFLAMGATWDFLQGDGPPSGYALFLAPFALMGGDMLYTAAKFLPPLLGAVAAVGAFFLARRWMHPAGAITAALLAAILPELLLRGAGLFQATLDLALLPWFLLGALRVAQGEWKGAIPAGIFGLLLLLADPYFMALLLPTLAMAAASAGAHRAPKARWGFAAAGAAVAAALLWAFVYGPLAPGTVREPGEVDLLSSLTVPGLLFGAAGLAMALLRPSPYGWAAAAFAATMLAATFAGTAGDPALFVAPLGYGIALLAAVPVSETFRVVGSARPQAQTSTTFGVLALSTILTLPSGMGLDPWYRTYDAGELAAYEAVGALHADVVVTGSWQAQVGYRALTGGEVQYNPDFFADEGIRDYELQQHPRLLVLVDQHAVEEGVPTGFLQSWEKAGQWGTTVAYRAP